MSELLAHEHEWAGYPDDKSMVICTVPGCETMARIKDLISSVKNQGIVQGDYHANVALLQKGWIKRHRRPTVNDYVRNHPITREKELAKAYDIQVRMAV